MSPHEILAPSQSVVGLSPEVFDRLLSALEDAGADRANVSQMQRELAAFRVEFSEHAATVKGALYGNGKPGLRQEVNELQLRLGLVWKAGAAVALGLLGLIGKALGELISRG